MSTTQVKPFYIPRKLVDEAWVAVRKNKGSAGIDNVTLEMFEKDLEKNLYLIWNRMSSGTYFPPPVKAVPIPKKSGGMRILGVPNIDDRVAQTVVATQLGSKIDPIFFSDSYGYRPNRSAQDAVAVTRARCWKYDWVLEFDIKGLFDNISHDKLMLAVEKHVEEKWIKLYIRRWLTAPMRLADGTEVPRTKGTPQGGVVSPILSNLFMHYTFDAWMQLTYPQLPWCRYADDGLVHCVSKEQAQEVLNALRERMAECELELHPEKTKIIYCRDGKRTNDYPTTTFDFLGYHFRQRGAKGRGGVLFCGFLPAVSPAALKAMRQKIRALGWRNRADWSLRDIAKVANPIVRGWINYYGKFYPSALESMYTSVNRALVAWARHKYRYFRYSKTRAVAFIENIAKQRPRIFVHWEYNTRGSFV